MYAMWTVTPDVWHVNCDTRCRTCGSHVIHLVSDLMVARNDQRSMPTSYSTLNTIINQNSMNDSSTIWTTLGLEFSIDWLPGPWSSCCCKYPRFVLPPRSISVAVLVPNNWGGRECAWKPATTEFTIGGGAGARGGEIGRRMLFISNAWQ